MAELPAPPINTKTSAQVSAEIPIKDAVVILKNSGDWVAVNLSINIPKSKVPAQDPVKGKINIKEPEMMEEL